jgi:hypothetical protein
MRDGRRIITIGSNTASKTGSAAGTVCMTGASLTIDGGYLL